MRIGLGNLTDEQARTNQFIVPDISIVMHFGVHQARAIFAERDEMERHGGTLSIIGWSDGTTVFWHRPDKRIPLDADELALVYRAYHQRCGELERAGREPAHHEELRWGDSKENTKKDATK